MFKYYSTWTVARSSVRMCMPLASCTAVHVYNTVCTIRALNVKESLLRHCKGCARPHPLSHHAEELAEAFILAELAFQTSRRIQCFKASVWNFAFYSGGWCWKPLFFCKLEDPKTFSNCISKQAVNCLFDGLATLQRVQQAWERYYMAAIYFCESCAKKHLGVMHLVLPPDTSSLLNDS